jgi:ribonuclease D
MDILIARTQEQIDLAFERLSPATDLGCDTETSGLDPRRGRLLSVQFSDGEFNVLVPVSEGIALGKLASLLADEATTKIFHNAKFDIGFLSAFGYSVQGFFDTMVAEKLLTKGAGQSSSLADTLYRYFAVDLDKGPRKKFAGKWDGIWSEELVNYALSDVVYLPRLKSEQELWLSRLGLEQEFQANMTSIFG